MELTVFNYKTNKIRTIMKNGEPWFVLKDVCDVLELSNPSVVASRLDEDEKEKIDPKPDLGSRSNELITIISESGLYSVILRSDKPEAKQFKKWITSEVLPSIRKTGAYIKTPLTYIQALEALIETEREKERLALENTNLQIELDESMEYYTIKRVASMNRISWRYLNWRMLKNTSQAMEREVKKIFDANYENVNAYHVDVWKHEYPELQYGE
jgi:prophage antirepressor-like protein